MARQSQPQDDDGVRVALVWIFTGRWGITVLRANARLTLERLSHVGCSATLAAARRESAKTEHVQQLRLDMEHARREPRAHTARRLWR